VNCEKVTYYIEKGFLTELNVSEKMQIKLHSLICKNCRNYAPDSEIVNEFLHLLSEDDETPALSVSEKNKLKDALKNLG